MRSSTAIALFGIVFISICGFIGCSAFTEEINLNIEYTSSTAANDTVSWSQTSEDMDVDYSPAFDDLPTLTRLETSTRNHFKEQFPTGDRIVGGEPAEPEEIPFQVALVSDAGTWLSCGGSILSKKWVLTAHHCIDDDVNSFKRTTQIRAGSLEAVSGGTLHKITLVKKSGLPEYSDMALLKVWPYFDFTNPMVGYVKLPAQNATLATGTLLTVSGWGTTTEGGDISTELLKVEIPLVSQQSCNTSYEGVLTRGEICAGLPEGGKDSCQGDSGGPLFRNGVQWGVVSWGNGCARPDYPGIYAAVAFGRKWIKNMTGI